jgi:hypothetical protein
MDGRNISMRRFLLLSEEWPKISFVVIRGSDRAPLYPVHPLANKGAVTQTVA